MQTKMGHHIGFTLTIMTITTQIYIPKFIFSRIDSYLTLKQNTYHSIDMSKKIIFNSMW